MEMKQHLEGSVGIAFLSTTGSAAVDSLNGVLRYADKLSTGPVLAGYLHELHDGFVSERKLPYPLYNRIKATIARFIRNDRYFWFIQARKRTNRISSLSVPILPERFNGLTAKIRSCLWNPAFAP